MTRGTLSHGAELKSEVRLLPVVSPLSMNGEPKPLAKLHTHRLDPDVGAEAWKEDEGRRRKGEARSGSAESYKSRRIDKSPPAHSPSPPPP